MHKRRAKEKPRCVDAQQGNVPSLVKAKEMTMHSIPQTKHSEKWQREFWKGFDAYCRGQAANDLPNTAQKQGWISANRAEGAASVVKPKTVAAVVNYEAELEDYREDILDREYHARGAW